ncbi:MAG: acylphosphatase [Eubacterium sp.]|nr:acylphosphatase [Eubacterium sp.]MDD7210260.1 acylphosphatase [Lachnospiraceae bacterium]MDY5496808.1 acylphosphatase [Anaerobutyricum sp.]
MIRKHIIAHGRVQGVGMRFTVIGFARKYHVTGWVRNLYDGTVEMEVQGAPHRVALFMDELTSREPGGNRFIHIDNLDISDIPPVNATSETDFNARF